MTRPYPVALMLVLLCSCSAERGVPRNEVAYRGEPVREVVGTNYAANPGLPAPPENAEGVVPPPPPRFLGSSVSASSSNVGSGQ